MRYKIIISMPLKTTAEKMYKLIRDSKLYNSQEIIILNPIREVCDDCINKG